MKLYNLLPSEDEWRAPKVFSDSVSLSSLNGRLSTREPDKRARKSSSDLSRLAATVLDSAPAGRTSMLDFLESCGLSGLTLVPSEKKFNYLVIICRHNY